MKIGMSAKARHTELSFGYFIISRWYRKTDPDDVEESKPCASVNLVKITPSCINLVFRAVSIACCISSNRLVCKMPLDEVISLQGTKIILCAMPCDYTFL